VGLNSGAYKFVLFLHILCAIIGFGTVFFNGIYGKQSADRKGPEGVAISDSVLVVSKIAEYFIYAVFVLGLLLVWLSDEVFSFSDKWITLSMVLYIVGIGISHGVLLPNVKKMNALGHEMLAGPPPAGGPPPQVVENERRAQKVKAADGALKVVLVAILALMIWQP
jgi:uncharacterized membrane protein